MSYNWISSTRYTGVRYHQHGTRKHGVQYDKLFGLRYQLGKKRYENILGWASEGWTEQKASMELNKLKEAYKLGEGEISLSEKRRKAHEARLLEEQARLETIKKLTTFSQFWEKVYLPSQQHKAKGSLVAENALYTKWIVSNIGNIPLASINSSHIEEIKKSMLEAKRTPSSIKYAFAVVSQVWNMAKRDDLLSGDCPTKKVVLPKRDNKRERFLTLEESELLLSHLQKQSLQVHDMALLALYCGLRFGEIASLDWQSVNFLTNTLSIRDPKARTNRVAFLTSIPFAMLEERKTQIIEEGKTLSGLIFPSKKGDIMKSVSDTFTRTADKLFNQGITDSRQKVCFHSLRHTFASWLVQKGVDLYSVKELMGHADFKMTQRYSHLSPEGLRKAVAVIERE